MKKLCNLKSVFVALTLCVLSFMTFVSCSEDDDNNSSSASAIMGELGFTEPTLPSYGGDNALKNLTIVNGDEKFVFEDSTVQYVYEGEDDNEADSSYNFAYSFDADSNILYMKLLSFTESDLDGTISLSNIGSFVAKYYSGDALQLAIASFSLDFYKIYTYKVTKTDTTVKLDSYFTGDVSTVASEFKNSIFGYMGYNFPNIDSDDDSDSELDFVISWNTSKKTFTATVFEVVESEDDDSDTSVKKLSGTVKGTYTCSDAGEANNNTFITLQFTDLPSLSTTQTYSNYESLSTEKFTFYADKYEGTYTIEE